MEQRRQEQEEGPGSFQQGKTQKKRFHKLRVCSDVVGVGGNVLSADIRKLERGTRMSRTIPGEYTKL